MHIVLVHPEIPPNTGNIIRLSANVGAQLHLVKPIAFSLDDKQLRRAGLDYHEFAQLQVHDSWDQLCDKYPAILQRGFALTTKARLSVFDVKFQVDDWLVFGSETSGLSESIRAQFNEAHRIRLPMQEGQRSLNLSNAVAVTAFEAWRQCGFSQAYWP
jgi:tRNA (cytidine/uridine-2'-O-)-methyltransferase